MVNLINKDKGMQEILQNTFNQKEINFMLKINS